MLVNSQLKTSLEAQAALNQSLVAENERLALATQAASDAMVSAT